MSRRLVYLSGAPRVSTRAEAELSGPRSHVLGVIGAFEEQGWEVNRFILGDRVPRSWVGIGSERRIAGSRIRALAADLVRLAARGYSARQSWRAFGRESDWVYERFAVFQALGSVFQRHGRLWILETNGPGYLEARSRGTLMLAGWARRLEREAYRQCDYLVCVSDTLKKIIVEEFDIPAEKIVAVPNGVDTTLFDPARHKPIRLSEGFTVGYSGSLTAQQNVDLLLEAIHDLNLEDIPIHLTVVGEGPMRAAWESRAAGWGVSHLVRFTGQVPREKVPDYILGFDLGFSGHNQPPDGPIFYSPLKLYEYLAMAVPVVASEYEGTRRVVEDGRTGFLYTAGNKERLKSALRRAYEARARLHSMGQQAREKVVAQDSWNSRISALIAHIESTKK
jgi:glycosyltransferase involved in cell wall biosynthesis